MKRFSSLFPGLGWRHRDLDSNTFQVTLISWDAWEILLSHGCLVAWRTLASRPSLSSTSSTFSPPLLRWAGPCLPKKPTSAFLGFPCDSACKESACNAGDLWETWVGKIPWRRETLPTPVFWPGELHVLYSPWVHKESDTTEDFHFTSLQSWRKRHPVLRSHLPSTGPLFDYSSLHAHLQPPQSPGPSSACENSLTLTFHSCNTLPFSSLHHQALFFGHVYILQCDHSRKSDIFIF